MSRTKRLPFAEAADGAIGLETFLSAGLRLVHDGSLPLLRLIEAMSTRPAEIAGLDARHAQNGRPGGRRGVRPGTSPWILNAKDILFQGEEHPL